MLPNPIFELFGRGVYMYGICIAVGLLCCIGVFFLYTSKKGLSEKQEIDLNKFNYIFNGNEIEYTIQVPMDKLKEFANDFFVDETELEIIKESMIAIYDTVELLIG